MSRTEQKEQTRKRILEAAARGFKQGGYGGIGVDGLAKEAGVTSGAFYVHFDSKASAFRESIAHGVAAVADEILRIQNEKGRDWWPVFVHFYLGAKRKCALPESCALQTLTPELARSDEDSRAQFEKELARIAQVIANGPRSAGAPRDIETAYAAISTLIGSVTLARAVRDEGMADRIADATEKSLLAIRKSTARKSPRP